MIRRSAHCAVLAVVLLAAATPAASSPGEQEVWKHFLAWYKSYSGSLLPPDVAKAYSASLISEGLTPADATARMAVLKKIGATSPPEMMTLHFNKIFTQQQGLFSAEANAFLVRAVRELKPGKALDVAMGQGRNSLFLAKQGWDVTGYDLSDQGIAIARANAAKAGVTINTILASHQEFDFGKDRWDLIVMTYAYVSMEDAAFLQRVRDSLKPGGIVVVEQLNSGGPGPGPTNALFRSFQNLRVLHYEDTSDTADWSQEEARIGRIIVQKE